MNIKKCVSQAMIYFAVVSCFLAATYLGNEAVTVISQEIPVDRSHIIIIDAGHGGEDGGAVSCTGAKESEINLSIALKFNDLLHLLGYQTRMTRTTDISVYTTGATLAQKKVSDLRERVRIVTSTEDPILISIHQNTFSDSRYSGVQVFFNGAGESEALAKKIQDTFSTVLNPGIQRQIKRADGIYLMENVSCTAILAECGFLSNPREEVLLRMPAYQQKIAAVIGTTLSNFLDGQTND
ncbi:MAG: N-acetylmuramoyl-L-alanine amidase [Oscillospiraceae bacterium]|nr:N-acetylmuramoyl-L-alanine amidase [Oscillospiraceae bacterium]